jgi:hypothetical protein
MKRILFAIALALLTASAAPAQKSYPRPTWGIERAPDKTMEQMVTAREKLINHFVLAQPRLAWGVSVCGDDDVLTGEPNSWLTIYVYSDTLDAFALDYDKFATHTAQHTLQVDGITVVVEVIARPKTKGGVSNEQQPTGKRQDRGSSVPAFRRAA